MSYDFHLHQQMIKENADEIKSLHSALHLKKCIVAYFVISPRLYNNYSKSYFQFEAFLHQNTFFNNKFFNISLTFSCLLFNFAHFYYKI